MSSLTGRFWPNGSLFPLICLEMSGGGKVMRKMFLLLMVVFFVPAMAQEQVFLPVDLGVAQDGPTVGPSTEQILRVAVLNFGANTQTSTLKFFKNGPRLPLMDFGDGQWGQGEQIGLQILGGEVVTFLVKNREDDWSPGRLEDLLVEANLGSTATLHAWLETREIGSGRLVNRRLVIQPALLSTTGASLPVFVTGDEDTRVFLSNPSNQEVLVELRVTNRFEYRGALPGLQGEVVSAARIFNSVAVLAPRETRSIRVSEILRVVLEDMRGNPLSGGILRVSASVPILAKIE